MRPVEILLAALRRIPTIALEVDDAHGSAAARVSARFVAHIDLQRGRVRVSAPADTVPTLLRVFPSARPDGDGIVFDLGDDGDPSQALAAIRRRANVERLSSQFRDASP